MRLDPAQVDLPAIRKAVADAGYTVPRRASARPMRQAPLGDFTRAILTLFGAGVWRGAVHRRDRASGSALFEQLTERVPLPIGVALVLHWRVSGLPQRGARHAETAGDLPHADDLGVLAALAVGQWATAAVVVFFMRVGDYAEQFTTERARRAVKDLTALAPQTARVERDGAEQEVPIGEVQVGRDRRSCGPARRFRWTAR